jgi:hypothetical protein
MGLRQRFRICIRKGQIWYSLVKKLLKSSPWSSLKSRVKPLTPDFVFTLGLLYCMWHSCLNFWDL